MAPELLWHGHMAHRAMQERNRAKIPHGEPALAPAVPHAHPPTHLPPQHQTQPPTHQPTTQDLAQKHGWDLDHTNLEDRYVPGNYAKNYKMQNKLGSLGAHFVKNHYGERTDCWCAT